MESNLQVQNQMRKHIEEKLNEQLSFILQTNCNPDEVVKKLDVHKLEEEVCEKYSRPVESIEVKFSLENEELWASLNLADYDDYDKISQNLNNSRSISTQIRTLDKLLSAYIIDTKQKSWMPLSRNLQQCLMSSNDEIFQKSLKVHYKIISTPTASSAGYLNLIQALILMFNNEFFKNSQVINESYKIHRRTLSMFKLLLKTQEVVLKNWLHAKQKTIEEVLITFIYMLNYSLGNERELGALDFLAMLDSEAKWFKTFCYSLQTRNIILSCLKKTPNLTKYFVGTFLDYLDDSMEDSRNHRQFLNFSHSAYLLSQFLIYRQSFSIFPLKVRASQESITFEYFVFLIVVKINNWSESPRKRILIKLLRWLITSHYNLILNPEIRKVLFEPFNLKNVDKTQLYVTVERNNHILEIMNNLSKSQYNKLILYNLSDLKKSGRRYKRSGSCTELNNFGFSTSARTSREKNNVLQIIVNVAIACIRNFVNKSESQHYVNNVIFELIDCCQNLFDSNPRTFSFVNSNKLVITLKDFYRTVMNHDVNSIYYKSRIASSLCFFIESDFAALKTLESESEFLHEIVCNALTTTNSLYGENNLCTKLILSIANHSEGSGIIMNNHDLLIKQFLMKIWSAEIDEEEFVSSSNLDFELKSNQLLHFLHIISYNFKAVRALMSFENESTIIENQEKPLVLSEIIEICLDPTCSGAADTALGLKILKIFVTNADVLIYLQNNYKLQENLIELQVTSCMPHSDDSDSTLDRNSPSTAILIDECSALRHNILLSVKYAGRVDAVLNEKLIGQTQIAVAPYQSSSALRRYQKASSELQKFLHDAKGGLHDHGWLLHARRAFKISCKEKYKMSVIADLVDQLPKIATRNSFAWPSANAILLDLFPEEYHGVTVVVRFAVQNGILQSSLQNEDNLTLLLKQSRTFLNYRPAEFMGFDWFVAVIFLMCSGNLEKYLNTTTNFKNDLSLFRRCKSTLLNTVNLPGAPLIWSVFSNVAKQKICDQFYRQLEIILGDTTRLNCALQGLGTSARHIVQKWLGHSFFTILDISEICNFVSMAILYPPEYVLFFVLAVFEHIKTNIFTATYELNLVTILKMTKILDFHLVDYFTFIDKLSKQYKNILQT